MFQFSTVLLTHIYLLNFYQTVPYCTSDSPSNPQRVHLLSGKGVVMMAAGLEHSLALTDSGDLYAFGDNLRYRTESFPSNGSGSM